MESSAAGQVETIPRTHSQRIGRPSLPPQRTLLTWLFVGRLVLALATLLGASLVWTQRPDVSFISTITVVFALTFTGYGAWAVFVRGVIPSRAFLQIQALVDLSLVTALVHLQENPSRPSRRSTCSWWRRTRCCCRWARGSSLQWPPPRCTWPTSCSGRPRVPTPPSGSSSGCSTS